MGAPDLRPLIGRRVRVYDNGILGTGAEIVTGPLLDVIDRHNYQLLIVDNDAGANWQIPLDMDVTVAVEVVSSVDVDALTAVVAGDPAPDARHAARVLRHLGPLLRDTRTRRELTQQDVETETGISRFDICRIENKHSRPTVATALKLLDWIGGEHHG